MAKASSTVTLSLPALRREGPGCPRFTARVGKPGALALAGFLMQASAFTGKRFATLESVARKKPIVERITKNVKRQLHPGNHTFDCRSTGKKPTAIKQVRFVNKGKERACLLVEVTNLSGQTQAMSYVHLEPGDTFECAHNEPITITTVLIVAGVVIVIITVIVVLHEVGVAVGGMAGSCHLNTFWVAANSCTGSCATSPLPGPCRALTTRKMFFGGTEPTSCTC